MPGSGASITNPARDTIGILRRERVAHYIADIVRDQIRLFDLQAIQHAGDIAALRFLVITGFRMRGEAQTAQVRNDHRVIARKLSRQGRPHVAGVGEAVQHDDGGSLAADPDVNGCAVGLNFFCLETRRKRLNPSCGR